MQCLYRPRVLELILAREILLRHSDNIISQEVWFRGRNGLDLLSLVCLSGLYYLNY